MADHNPDNQTEQTNQTNTNPLELSDEDFLKLNSPVSETETVADVADEQPNSAGGEGGESGTQTEGTEGQESKDPVQSSDGQEGNEGGTVQPGTEGEPEKKETEEAKPEGDVSSSEPTGSKPEGQKPEGEKPAEKPAVEVDHKAFYEKIMAPFVANGKTIQLKSPEEAVQLMQQGANYTRKMQAIAPHRKVLTMLENNNLLNEDKLSFFIDLENGNPEAIQKLLKDKNIDVMNVDTESEPKYVAGNHKVSDNEVQFRTELEELSSSPTGKETINIFTSWDEASKQAIWDEPSLMPILHAQREAGIYDLITEEMDRRKMLGKMNPNEPFLKAYQTIGDELAASGGFNNLKQNSTDTNTPAANPAPAASPAVSPSVAPASEKEAVPVATRAAAPKPTVENGDKAGAASPSRNTPKPAKPFINPLAMSDDEFLANFQGRV